MRTKKSRYVVALWIGLGLFSANTFAQQQTTAHIKVVKNGQTIDTSISWNGMVDQAAIQDVIQQITGDDTGGKIQVEVNVETEDIQQVGGAGRMFISDTGDTTMLDSKMQKVVVVKSQDQVTGSDDEAYEIIVDDNTTNLHEEMIWVNDNGDTTRMNKQSQIVVITNDDKGGKHVVVTKQSDSNAQTFTYEITTADDDDKDAQTKVMVWENNDSNASIERQMWVDDNGDTVVMIKSLKGIELDTCLASRGIRVVKIPDGAGDDLVWFGDSAMLREVNENIQIIKDGAVIEFQDNGTSGSIKKIIICKTSGVIIEDWTPQDANTYKAADITADPALELTDLTFAPNPNDGIFTVSFTAPYKASLEVQVFDIQGKEVYKNKNRKFEGVFKEEINLSDEKSGIYILRITHDNKTLLQKIVKQ